MASPSRSRCPNEHRRKQLLQLLGHDESIARPPTGALSPVLHSSKSLPALPDIHTAVAAPVVGHAAFLSPLKPSRRPNVDVARQPALNIPNEASASDEMWLPSASLPSTAISSSPVTTRAVASRLSTREQPRAKAVTLDLQEFQMEQIPPTQLQRLERKLGDRESSRLGASRRVDGRGKHARDTEVARRRAIVTAASQNFFERLAMLPIREAIDNFEAQRESLLEFCLQRFRSHANGREMEIVHAEIVEMLEKADGDLQCRLRKQQQEERHALQKKKALQYLKKSQQEQIKQHLVDAEAQRKKELAVRTRLASDQETLDKRYEAREAQRKQRALANGAKIAEQIRSNAVARESFALAVQGSSPLYRTPYWSDESGDRLQGFQRPSTVQAPTQSPVIHSKQRCQWYD